MSYRTVKEILELSIIEGTRLMLPDTILDYANEYTPVKKALEGIGGKWVNMKVGFKFDENPTDFIAQIIGGVEINLKKDFQFFGTPDELADEMATSIHFESDDKVLEPSAGRGALIKAVFRSSGGRIKYIDCCELMEQNQRFLDKIDGVRLIGTDFLQLQGRNDYYDMVVANPPFTKAQDIDHVYKMWEVTKNNGTILTLMSTGWRTKSDKKSVSFREWLERVGAYQRDIPAGAFKESGTNVATVFLVIDVIKEKVKIDFTKQLIDLF